MIDRDSARQFLNDLKRAIMKDAPRGAAMDPVIRSVVRQAKKDDTQKYLRLPEAAFLNRFVVPVLFRQLVTVGGLSEQEARKVLLNEYWRTMPEYSLQSPFGQVAHPFNKVLGRSASRIYQEWRNPEKRFGLSRNGPDFALRYPFPHKIVFEGKYHVSSSAEIGRTNLVRAIYEAFFYVGLPTAAATKTHAAWDYDYACLVAFDASPNGSLTQAWEELDEKVRRSLWDGANIYVMILRD